MNVQRESSNCAIILLLNLLPRPIDPGSRSPPPRLLLAIHSSYPNVGKQSSRAMSGEGGRRVASVVGDIILESADNKTRKICY